MNRRGLFKSLAALALAPFVKPRFVAKSCANTTLILPTQRPYRITITNLASGASYPGKLTIVNFPEPITVKAGETIEITVPYTLS